MNITRDESHRQHKLDDKVARRKSEILATQSITIFHEKDPTTTSGFKFSNAPVDCEGTVQIKLKVTALRLVQRKILVV